MNNETVITDEKKSAFDEFLEFLKSLRNMLEKIEKALGMGEKKKTNLAIMEQLNDMRNAVLELQDNMDEMMDNNLAFRSLMGNDMCKALAEKCRELEIEMDGIDLEKLGDEKSVKEFLTKLAEFDETVIKRLDVIGKDLDAIKAEHPEKNPKVYIKGDVIAIGFDSEKGGEHIIKAYNRDLEEIVLSEEEKKGFTEIVPNFDSYQTIKELLENDNIEVNVKTTLNMEEYAKSYSEMFEDIDIKGESIKRKDGTYDFKIENKDASLTINLDNKDGRILSAVYEKDGESIEVYGKVAEDMKMLALSDDDFAILIAHSPLSTQYGNFFGELLEDKEQDNKVHAYALSEKRTDEDKFNDTVNDILSYFDMNDISYEKTVYEEGEHDFKVKIKPEGELGIFLYDRDVSEKTTEKVHGVGRGGIVAFQNGEDVTDKILGYAKACNELRAEANKKDAEKGDTKKNKGEER